MANKSLFSAAAAAVLAVAGAAQGQTLPAPTLPLDGTVRVPCIQGVGYKNCTLSQILSGNAASAVKLQTGRTVSIGGDITVSAPPTFDGTGNITIPATVSKINGQAPAPSATTDTTNPANITFTASGSGALGVSVKSRMDLTVEITDYCTSAQIASNIATCGQAAINAAQALTTGSYGGATIHFPAKFSPYKLTGTLTVTSSFVKLKGDGKQATYIDCSGNVTADCLVFGNGGAQIRDVGVSDLGVFGSTSATAGAAVHIKSAYRPFVLNVDLENVHRGVDVDTNNNSILLKDVLINLNQAAGNADYGVYWHDKGDGTSRSDVLYLYNVTEAAKYQAGTVGLLLDGLVNTVVGDGLHLLKNQYGMRVVNSANSASYVPAFSDLHDVEIEGASVAALSIEAGSEWKFVNADITNSYGATSQGSADTYAVQCLPDSSYSVTRGLMIANSRIGLTAQSGAFLNCRDAQMSNIQFASTGEAALNTYPVISVGSSAQDVILSGITCEEFGGAAKASQCLSVASGAARIKAYGINPQYVNASPWYVDANSPTQLNFQIPAGGFGTFSPASDGQVAGERVDQNGATYFLVKNANATGAVAGFESATNTANSYCLNGLVDNGGSPYQTFSCGSAVQTSRLPAITTLPLTGLVKGNGATTALSAAVAGTDYVAPTGSGASLTGITASQIGGVTAGSVVFGGASALAQDNSNLFWDDAHNALGIGNNAPYANLSSSPGILARTSNAAGDVRINATNTATGAGVSASLGLSTGTGNSYCLDQLIDNSGAPFRKTSCGSAVTVWKLIEPTLSTRLKLTDQGSCTMSAGACSAQTLGSTYSAAPVCLLTWTGTGTLAGVLKVAATTTTVTPSSSNSSDTAQVNWACFGN
jgi:hypothetical protein